MLDQFLPRCGLEVDENVGRETSVDPFGQILAATLHRSSPIGSTGGPGKYSG